MSTRTEEALQTLDAAMGAIATAQPGSLPPPSRNLALVDVLDAMGEATAAALNLVDGNGEVQQTELGQPAIYEIEHTATVEWIVQAADQAMRDAAFDAGLVAIADAVDAINAGIEGGTIATLDAAEIGAVDRSNLAIDGTPQLKGAVIEIRLTFTSNRPF